MPTGSALRCRLARCVQIIHLPLLIVTRSCAPPQLGVAVTDTFQASDLLDEKNIPKVLVSIHAFADALAAQGVQCTALPKDGAHYRLHATLSSGIHSRADCSS